MTEGFLDAHCASLCKVHELGDSEVSASNSGCFTFKLSASVCPADRVTKCVPSSSLVVPHESPIRSHSKANILLCCVCW
ncbi:hypothetical protein Nepgr_029940 [Nepenthes gracilis]|uniref:Uncharacterized protein n=1 Tax=Nepenthes gracilis TaxID=150966 RepID=A0AAD3TG92_NEPGR|nr:hypothetical protein Nepgr_029940 [Nepenthes gracilis]